MQPDYSRDHPVPGTTAQPPEREHAVTIKGFDSLEEMLAYMAKQEAAANAAVRPRQQAGLGWGKYGLRVVDDMPIWTEIYTEAEAADGEEPETVADLQDSHRRGYRYGRHYSRVEPLGELGSVHIATMWPISEADFNVAQEIGWYPTADSAMWFSVLLERMAREVRDDEAGITHSKFDADSNEEQTFFPVDDDADNEAPGIDPIEAWKKE